MSVKTMYWAQLGKSDDFVKKALKLDELTEDAMKASPKYKYYQKYLYKAEGVKMGNWAFDEVNPTTIWNQLGLNRVSATQRDESAAFKVYERYATKYDNKVYKYEFKAYTPSTDAEMDALLDKYYSYAYHRMMTHYPTKEEIKNHANYDKFKKFMEYRKHFYF